MTHPDRSDKRDAAPGASGAPDDPDRPRSYVRRVLVAAGVSIGLLAFALFLWYSVYVILLLFAGVLLAILFRGLADPISDWTGIRHRWSLTVVLVVLAALAGGFLWFAAPQLLGQIGELIDRLPRAVDTARERLASTTLGERVVARWDGQGMVPSGSDLLSRFSGIVFNVVDILVALLVVLFTGMFIAFDPKLYVRGTLRLLPVEQRHRGGEVLGAIGHTLKWWLIGQALTMVIIATATALGLWLLGVPLALLLGIVAGLFNFIPNFGPLIAAVPATLLALASGGIGGATSVVVLFVVLQNLEGNLLTPLIQRRAVDLPPAVGIIAQILLGILAGPVGLILAWPLAAAVHVAVRMLYVEDVLGDRGVETPADDHDAREVRQATEMADEVTEDIDKPEDSPAETQREGRDGRGDADRDEDGRRDAGGHATAGPAPPRSHRGSR